MSARAEVPTPVQQSPAGLNGAKVMSIALIGPNDTHRKIMVRALSGAHNRTVLEFDDYPADLGEVPRLLEQKFDVVMIDVDSDESYALALVESIAATGKATVIAYSERTDQALMSRCGRAGAQDFLPLPSEGQEEGVSATATAAEPTLPAGAGGLHVVERPAVKDEHSQQRIEPKAVSADSVIDARQVEDSRPQIADLTRTETAPSDFKDWDAEHLFSMMPAAAKEAAAKKAKEAAASEAAAKEAAAKEAAAKEAAAKEVAAREAAAKEAAVKAAAAKEAAKAQEAIAKVKQEILKTAAVAPGTTAKSSPAKIAPAYDPVPSPAPAPAEAPAPVEHVTSLLASPPPRIKLTEDMPLFRGEVKEAEDEQPKAKGKDLTKWVFIAAGLGLLAGLLLLVFMHPSRQATPAAPVVQPAQSQPQTPAAVPPVNDTNAKPSPIPSPTPTTNIVSPVAATPQKEVSSDMMDAQLSAPSKISKDIKTAKPADEPPPPSGITPVAIDNNSGVPGQVFGGGNNVRVVPQVSAISAGVAEGMLLHRTEPLYPMIAKQSHVSGTVVVKATITKAGTIEGAQMISGPRMLGPAALDAVKTWRYRPYLLDNKPVAVETTISVVFRIGDR